MLVSSLGLSIKMVESISPKVISSIALSSILEMIVPVLLVFGLMKTLLQAGLANGQVAVKKSEKFHRQAN